MRTPSVSTMASDSEVDGYTFYDTKSEKEFQLQINPTAKKSGPRSLGSSIEVVAVAKRPVLGEQVASSVAVHVSAAHSKPPLLPKLIVKRYGDYQ